MVSFSLFSLVVSFAFSVAATPVNIIPLGSSPLQVAITAGDTNAVVKLALTNFGPRDLEILNLGTFLFDAPIEKVTLFRNGERLNFKGLLMHYDFRHLRDSSFTVIRAGQTIEKPVELAGLYDFTETGTYTIEARGALSFASLGDRDALPISGTSGKPENAFAFATNQIDLHIDAIAAAAVEPLGLAIARRGIFQGCSGSRASALQTAFKNAVTISRQAAEAAASGSADRFQEHFKTTDANTRKDVAARFKAIAKATTSTSSGVPRYYCTDPAGECKDNILAYTHPETNTVANCDIFYTDLPALSMQCSEQDQVGTVIHELSHTPGVYGPYCQDYAYGYTQASKLTAEEAEHNADTFALYAKAVYLNCGGNDSGPTSPF